MSETFKRDEVDMFVSADEIDGIRVKGKKQDEE